ncbi:MAG: hypothetical protein KC620_22270, partial [Myxococcales bacterium]|nr:hypothetical protein [Myxococcales bacterium]
MSATGCLPAFDDECSSANECPAERPLCVGGVCAPVAGGDEGADRGSNDARLDGEADGALDGTTDDGGVDALGVDACVVRRETCDGTDEDCDGVIDEQSGGAPLNDTCYAGPEETRGVGECRAGVKVCTGGVFGACQGERSPVDEACNLLDDDCDGRVDENTDGRSGLLEPCAADDLEGMCAGGVRACIDGVWGPCEGEVSPGTEVCDTVDNDCDGAIDEGLPANCLGCDGIAQPCYPGPADTLGVGTCRAGEQPCVAGQLGPCAGAVIPNAVERCDGLDDDCDSRVDEETGGGVCSVGFGACRREGRLRCVAGSHQCDAVAAMPGVETCNGTDDDCDRRTDEGLDGAECVADVGGCGAPGIMRCIDGAVRCEAIGDPEAGAEQCNGLDDDCDGMIDEAADGVTLCQALQASGRCERGSCRAWACNSGFIDDDGRASNGCTRGCALPPVAVRMSRAFGEAELR